MKIASILPAILLVVLILPSAANAQDKGEYRISAGKVELEPADGERALIPRGRRHAIIQFYRIPGELLRTQLAVRGIVLKDYLGGNAYIAEFVDGSGGIQEFEGIRATVGIRPWMKRSSIYGGKEYREPRKAGAPIRSHIKFREGTDFTQARAVLNAAGIETAQRDFHYSGLVLIEAPWEALKAVSTADDVAWVEPFPFEPKSLNSDSRKRVRAQAVFNKPAFRRPTGQGIRVGVWDGGAIFQHVEFSGREVIVVQSAGDFSDHATHVAGIIASSGQSVARSTGIAGEAALVSYDFFGDVWGEMAASIDIYGVRISNNSWGYAHGWNETEDDETEEEYWQWLGDSFFGKYTTTSAALDTLVRNRDLPIVFSAGNERNDFYLGPHRNDDDEDETEYEDLHPADPDHGAIITPHTAKNAIVAGALNKDDVIADFSSTGPTYDGRIKPDITAPGVHLYSTTSDNFYDSYSGTSMAAPVITGVCCLLIDQYETCYGSKMGSDLLKAILLNSARDVGRAGPDYDYGFGVADVELASKMLGSAIQNAVPASAASGRQPFDLYARFYEHSITNEAETSYTFRVPVGSEEFRATIVWNDPPAQFENAALINNLDLWAVSPANAIVRPFILYKNNPTALATREINSLDNVEQIRITNPEAGEWQVVVKGTNIPQGPQGYALVLSAGKGNNAPLKKTNGSFSIQRFFATSDIAITTAEAKTSFTDGDVFYGFAELSVPVNADYGYFKGTLTAKWYLRNESGELIMLYNDTRDSYMGRENFYRWRTPMYEIPNGMAAGNYTLQVVITMHNGQTATASYGFSVQ